MKKLALAAAFSVAATAGYAGSPAPVVIAPVAPAVIVEDTSSSAGGILVPLMALILLAAAASN